MNLTKTTIARTLCCISILLISANCGRRDNSSSQTDSAISDSAQNGIVEDSVKVEEDTVAKPGDEDYKFADADAVREFLEKNPDAHAYADGIIPIIAQTAPEYAKKLIANQYSGFIVVDKASMRVLLYDKYGHVKKSYGMACAKNYGTKHKKADSRTPEGFFSVEGKYDSTDWLYTDDNGKTSKKKGQFGPRFIRIKIPTTSQIGIHGTCSPWSIGHRASHGCIRLTNENIMELVDLVEIGMPVIINPGKRDRQVNRQEGYNIPYFATDNQYTMSDEEKKLRPRSAEEIAREKELEAAKAKEDSLKKAAEEQQTVPEELPAAPEETPQPVKTVVPDSVSNQ